MRGETDLAALIAGMAPVLDPEVYIFACVDALPPGIAPLMRFTETEGETLILRKADADAAGVTGSFPCRRITLTVHSALEAVGLTAAVARALTEAGIPTNIVAAFHHDHLFVPEDKAQAAMAALDALRRTGG